MEQITVTENVNENGKLEFRRAFVAGAKNNQEKADVYEKKFAKIDAGRKSWNWCAFLVTSLWLLYRKMYKVFFILLAVTFAIEAILAGIETAADLSSTTSSLLSSAMGIAVAVVMGFWGDKLYLQKIDGLYETSPTGETIRRHGGTSLKGVIIYCVVCLVLIVALVVLFAAAMAAGELATI